MRQISKKDLRNIEPEDYLYEPKGTLLQEAVNVLLNKGGLAVKDLLDTFKNNGVILNSDIIEKMLCLECGTLNYSSQSHSSLVDISKYISFNNK